MPLAFPSHQGVILPLWRRFPHAIDGVAVSVGAAMPDIVDALAWPIRGELGQWMGHSLIGTFACVALGIPLVWLARRVLPKGFLARLDRGAPDRPTLVRMLASLAIGSLSHVASDFVTHANCLLFWPFAEPDPFPAWWKHAWTTVSMPWYREPYPIAPHWVSWALVTVLGAVSFFWCVFSGKARSTR